MLEPRSYQPPADALADRVILVTGAGRGIGRAAALAFAAHGATTVLLGRRVVDLEAVYDEIEAHGWPQPAIYPLDLMGAGPGDYETMASALEDQLGHLDGLLLNAGLLGTLGPIEHADPEEFTQLMQVNVTANMLAVRACIPVMRRSADASIVLTASGVGRRGRAYWGGYCVSKFAVEGLMQVLADELADTPIRVNSLNPGAVRTRMRAAAYPAEDPGTLASAEDIMPAYLYLMGAASRGINGQALNAQA